MLSEKGNIIMKNQSLQELHLFSSVQKGDKKAYNTLFRNYYPMLCAYCNRFVNLEDSEEIVQDTMLWLWENRNLIEIETSLSGYLFKTIYSRAMNRIYQNQSQARANTIFSKNMQAILQDIDTYQIEELKKQIKKAIDALPPTYRESFVMHRFKDMSYKEIALSLNVSSKTVDYRIQQALKILRVQLKDYLLLILLFHLSK